MPTKFKVPRLPTQDLRSYVAIQGEENRKRFLRALDRKTKQLQNFLLLEGDEKLKAEEEIRGKTGTIAETHAAAHCWAVAMAGVEGPGPHWDRAEIFFREVCNMDPPDNLRLEPEGSWILIKEMPCLEFNVAPLSLWFAEPWPCSSSEFRVKVVTPLGSLGVLPSEYSRIDDLSPYMEEIGQGYELVFFGDASSALPYDRLHYIMSRGISKLKAFEMLLGDIKSPGVCWLEPDPGLLDHFGLKWPGKNRVTPKRIQDGRP